MLGPKPSALPLGDGPIFDYINTRTCNCRVFTECIFTRIMLYNITMTKRPLISTRKLRKTYGKHDSKFEALRGIDLDIAEGESIAIVGKSGSGKSTLMHLLALLDRPTSGEIRLKGTKTSQLKARRLNTLRNKQFGFVFQSFFMNANDTVLNNVILPLKIAGVGYRERRRRAMEALKVVDLEDKARNKANDLSGGQKQRVCIARAIVNNPKVIFADEPTGNLDSGTGEKIQQLLFGLNKEKGITLIIVTHDEDLAARCERQVHVSDGQIVSDSKNAELVDFSDYDEEEFATSDWEKEPRRRRSLNEDLDADGIRKHSDVHRINVDEEGEEQ